MTRYARSYGVSAPFSNQTIKSSGGLPVTYVPSNYAADGEPVSNQWKDPVSCHTTADIALSGLQVVDSIQIEEGDRVLVKEQVIQADNGIYVASAGPWQRARDMYLWAQFPGAVVSVADGATTLDTLFLCFAPEDGTIGVTANNWISVSTAAVLVGTIAPLSAYVSDATGNPIASATTSQEIGYISGLTGPLQDQLDGIYATSDTAFSIAVSGTNAAASAKSTANSAFSISVAGTNAAATAQSTASSAYSIAVTGTTIGSLAYNYALTLGDKYVRTTRFVQIGSGTSGAIAIPANATIVLDDFGGTTDAIITSIGGGRPTYTHVFTAGGAVVATTFDSGGNYTLSGTPAAYPVALVYRVRQLLSQFDSTSADILGGYDVEQIEGIQGTPNQVYVNGSTATQEGPITLSLPQDVATTSSPTFSNVYATNITVISGVAAEALSIAIAGTNAAAAAQATANSAYTLAQIGTNVGTNAYNLATSGSNVAYEALQIAIAGTNAWLADTDRFSVLTVTSGTTSSISTGKPVYLVNSAAGAVTLLLPNALNLSGLGVTLKKISSDNNSVTLSSATGTQTIDGSASQVVYTQYVSISVTTDGTNWYII